MHEAGLLAVAVAEALAAGGPGGQAGSGDPGAPPAGVTVSEAAAAAPLRPVAIEIRVHDPIHVAPESARLHAELALRARGLYDVLIEVTADPVDCVLCGVANEARAEHPFCAECGWPLPDKGGHAVEAVVRWATA
jgi:hypothetical protein